MNPGKKLAGANREEACKYKLNVYSNKQGNRHRHLKIQLIRCNERNGNTNTKRQQWPCESCKWTKQANWLQIIFNLMPVPLCLAHHPHQHIFYASNGSSLCMSAVSTFRHLRISINFIAGPLFFFRLSCFVVYLYYTLK